MTHVRLLALILATVLLAACERASDMIPGEGDVDPAAGATEAPPLVISPSVTTGTDTATPTPAIADHELARSVVQIHIVDTRTLIQTIRDGSGVVIDGDAGLILTAYSLVQPYAASGAREYSTIAIGVNDGNGGSPRLAYEAELIAANVTSDLAVLRISREYQGDPLTPGEAGLIGAELGDSSIIEPGDGLRLFAHPGLRVDNVESQALRVTKGTVTGRRGQVSLPGTSRLKLDARLSYGATGGPAFDVRGALVGIMVPEHYVPEHQAGDVFVSQLRPLQLADELIEIARQFPDNESYLPPLLAAEPPAGFDSPPAEDGSWISRPAFAENATNLGNQTDLLDYQRGFVSETQQLYFEFAVQGLTKDVPVEERWFLNGVLQDSLSSSYPWAGNGFTMVADQISVPATSGLPDGIWRLEIWANDTLRAASAAVVGTEPAPPAIANIEFGALAAENGAKLTDPAADADQLLMFFDYSGMTLSRSIRWIVTQDDSLKYQSPELAWPGGTSGRFWIGYASTEPLGAGTWHFELIIDGTSRADAEVIVP